MTRENVTIIIISLLIIIFTLPIIKDVVNLLNEVEELRIINAELKNDYDTLWLEYDLIKRKYNILEDKLKDMNESPSRSSSRRQSIGKFIATAYTDDVESQGKWVGQTASGMKPQVGVIAVDPKIIPLGTELYVEGYGQAIAGDTGGAIKGNKIDVFLPDRDSCIKWGRKEVKVWRIE